MEACEVTAWKYDTQMMVSVGNKVESGQSGYLYNVVSALVV